MKKRILSFLLAAIMIASLLPVTAAAATHTTITAGVLVNSDGVYMVNPGSPSTKIAGSGAAANNYGISFTASGSGPVKVTFDNVNIETPNGGTYVNAGYTFDGTKMTLSALCFNVDTELTLMGTNKITVKDQSDTTNTSVNTNYTINGLIAWQELNIKSGTEGASLTIDLTEAAAYNTLGFFSVAKNVTNGARLISRAGTAYRWAYGFYSPNCWGNGEAATFINNGYIEAYGGSNAMYSFGVFQADGNGGKSEYINNGTIKAYGGSSDYAKTTNSYSAGMSVRTLTNKGTIEVYGGNQTTAAASYGLFVETGTLTNEATGTITATGGSTTSGASYGIYSYGKLNNAGIMTGKAGTTTSGTVRGIYATNDLTNSGGSMVGIGTSAANSVNGIYTTGKLTASGGTMEGSGLHADGGFAPSGIAGLNSTRTAPVDNSTKELPQKSADKNVIITTIPFFYKNHPGEANDARILGTNLNTPPAPSDTTETVSDKTYYTVTNNGTTYYFDGWYTARTGGEKVESGFTAGTTYYAHWKNAAGKTVLTEGVTVKADGLYIGETKTDLSDYGLTFTAATTDPVAPATLTMDNAAIDTGSGVNYSGTSYAALYSDVALTIALLGENTIRLGDGAGSRYGIYAKGELTVNGSSLNVTAGAASGSGAASSYGVYSNAALTNNGTLTVTSGAASSSGSGLAISYGVYSNAALTNNGTLTATAGAASSSGAASSYGVFAASAFTNNMVLTATGGTASSTGSSDARSYGVYCRSPLTNNGTLTVTAGTASGSGSVYSYGVYASQDITLSADSTVTSYGEIKTNSGKIIAAGATVTGATEAFTSGETKSLTQKGADPIVITLKPIFDLVISDTEITEDNFASYVKGETKVGDYTFAGWFSTTKGEHEFTGTYAEALIGTYYYAKWTNKAGNTVLTDGIEIKADGVHIGGSAEAATDTELAKYGIKFTAPANVGDPAILELDGATIAPTMEQPGRETQTYCYYSAIYSATCPLRINVKSESSVLMNSFVPKSGKNNVIVGIYANNNPLTISGEKLNVSADGCNKAMLIYGIYASGKSCNIDGKVFTEAKNTCSGDNANASAIMSDNLYFHGKAEVTAVVTRTMDGATTRYADAINAMNGSLNISGDAVVNGYGGIGTDEYYGVWLNGDILVCDNAVLNAYGGTKSGTDVKEALLLVNAGKTITVKDNGKIVADSAVKNLGKYGDYYTVTGADTDIASKSAGSTLTKAGDANIEISAKTYTVSFNANGGTPAPETVTTLAYVTEPLSPVKSGYAFAGWFRDPAFTQAWDFGNEYVRADMTLYAKWVQKSAAVSGTVMDETPAPVDEAFVYLMRGDVIFDTYMTGSDGAFSFSNVPAGEYQLVVQYDNGSTFFTTDLVSIDENGVVTGGGNITLYTDSKTSSAVEIAGNDTPDVMVGGLAEVANARKNGSVSVAVTLEVEKLAENAVDPDDKAKIEDKADSTQTLDYIDMTLLLKVNNNPQDNITDTGAGKLLEVVIPYDLSGKTNIALYRQHGSDPTAFKLPEGEANKTDDGEYVIIDKANNQIRAFLRYFSTYAIGYAPEQPPYYGGDPVNPKKNTYDVCPKDETCPIEKFTDTANDYWWHDGIHYCLDNGLMIGVEDTKFDPTGSITRGMVVTMLWRLDGQKYPNYALSFKDVPSGQWYTEAVRWAAAEKIVEGYDTEHFGPNDPVTREQLATILYRYAKYRGQGFTGAWMFLLDFVDRADISSWADEAMHWCSMKGIVTGRDGKVLDPKGNANRAEAAAMMQRFCEALEKSK